MSQTEATRQSDYIRPPRAGTMANVSITTTPIQVNLASVGYVAPDMSNADKTLAGDGAVANTYGLVGHYVTFYPESADAGVIFGPTQASVMSAAQPVLANTGILSAGICYRIPAGQERSYKITANDQWLGVVGSASGSLRIFQSSP